MKRRICPDSAAPLIFSIAFSQSASVACSTSTPSHFITSGTVSRSSFSMSTLPLYLGSKRSQIELIVRRLFFVDDDPGHPRLPRRGEVAARVVGGAAQVVDQVFLEVRDRRRFEFLQVAEFVHFVRHPVGDDEEAAAARFTVRQQRLHLGEELFVGVDVFDVLDRDAGFLFEVAARSVCRCRAASWRSSARPGGLPSTFTRLPLRRRRRVVRRLFDAAAAGRERDRRRQRRDGQSQALVSARAGSPPSRRDLPSSAPPSLARLASSSITTCMCSGSQLSTTRAPPPGSRWRSDSSALGTRTVIRTPSPTSTTIWVAVPR